jgi:hypothetical protein
MPQNDRRFISKISNKLMDSVEIVRHGICSWTGKCSWGIKRNTQISTLSEICSMSLHMSVITTIEKSGKTQKKLLSIIISVDVGSEGE